MVRKKYTYTQSPISIGHVPLIKTNYLYLFIFIFQCPPLEIQVRQLSNIHSVIGDERQIIQIVILVVIFS